MADFSAAKKSLFSRRTLERAVREGKNPVGEREVSFGSPFPEYLKVKITLREAGRTILPRLNTKVSPIVEKYREGKVKSSPVRAVK